MDKNNKAQKLVDMICDEGFETYSKIKVATKKIDVILDALDECGCMGGQRSLYSDAGELDTSDTYEDMPGMPEPEVEQPDDFEDKIGNEIPSEPNQVLGVQANQLSDEMGGDEEDIVESLVQGLLEDRRAEYRKYFLSKLASFGVKSPAHLNPERKKQFFNSIKAGWKKAKK